MKKSLSKKKIIKIVSFIAIFIIFIGLIVVYEFVKMRTPVMSGKMKLKGLSQEVVVLRDKMGIPHIEAQTQEDAFLALGYVMAQERLFQMDMSRKLAKGELASFFGELKLDSDKMFRTLGLHHYSQKMIKKKVEDKSFDPTMLRLAQAYFSGVNTFIEEGLLPVEYTLLKSKPEPFSLEDSYAFMGLMGFSFGIAPTMDALLTHLNSRLNEKLVDEMRIESVPYKKELISKIQKNEKDPTANTLWASMSKVLSSIEEGFMLFDGSNGWVLSGDKTKNKKPILANDPHITFVLPGVWFEAHIKAPHLEEYGHFLPLVPFPVLSHNRIRAWGITMSLTDDMDLYSHEISADHTNYLFKKEHRPLNKRVEKIRVKDKAEVAFDVFETHHGPLISKAFKYKPFSEGVHKDREIALDWSFYHPDNDPLSVLYKMMTATNMSEFKSAIAKGRSPGLNILYADQQNIAWWLFGTVWKKNKNLKTDFILDGVSGEHEKLGELTFAEKPFVENPASGLIVSANSRPEGFPDYMRGDWQADDRMTTLMSLLEKKNDWSIDELKEVQTLAMNFENKDLRERLIEELGTPSESWGKNAISAQQKLKDWNLISDSEAIAPTLYYTWIVELTKMLLVDLTEDELEMFFKAPNAWLFFKKVMRNPNSVWWNKMNRPELMKKSFQKMLVRLEHELGDDIQKWQWGKIHTLTFNHPFGQLKPLNAIFNLGPYPVPSAYHEVANFKYFGLKDGFKVKAGASTRRIIDYSNIETSFGILPIGNSGHLLSPFYKNQVQMFINGQYREQKLSISKKETVFKLQLFPE